MRAFKIYAVSNFQIYSIINYYHYTIHYISMTCFTTGSLYFFTPFIRFDYCPPPHLSKPTSSSLSITKSLDFFLPEYLSSLCLFYLHIKHFSSDTSGHQMCGTNLYDTAAKSFQLCPTLWDHIDGSPPGSAVPGILQARTLEWVAISFPSAWKWKVKVKSFSRVWLFVTPWTAAYQASLSMGFSRQEYWSGLPLPSPSMTLVSYNLTQFWH